MTMGLRNALKKLRRQFRLRRGLLLAGLLVAAAGVWLGVDRMREDAPSTDPGVPAAAAIEDEERFEAVLHKRFLCGEQYEPLGILTWDEAEAMLRSHAEWKLEGIDGSRVVYAVDVEDFSDRKSTRLNSSHVKISYAVF